MSRFFIGCIAGLAATIPMTAAMVAWHRRLPRKERDPLPPYHITRAVSQKIGIDHKLEEEERRILTLTAHFGYGAAAGGVYGLFDENIPLPPAVRGMTYGLGVWAISYLKALHSLALYRHPDNEPPRRKAMMIVAHLVWGSTLGLLTEHIASRQK